MAAGVAAEFPDVGPECLELDSEPLAEGSFKRVFRARLRGASAVGPDGSEVGETAGTAADEIVVDDDNRTS